MKTAQVLFAMLLTALAIIFYIVGPAKASDDSREILQKEFPHAWLLTCYEKYDMFDGCMQSTRFTLSGNLARQARTDVIDLSIRISRDNTMTVLLIGKGWRFTPTKKYKLGLVFTKETGATRDNQYTANAGAVEVGNMQGLVSSGATDLSLLGEIMIARVMGVVVNDTFVAPLTMKGSYKAIEQLLWHHANYKTKNQGDTFDAPAASSLEDTF